MLRPFWNVALYKRVCYCSIYQRYHTPSTLGSPSSIRNSARKANVIQKIKKISLVDFILEFNLLVRSCCLKWQLQNLNVGPCPQEPNRIKKIAIRRYLRFGILCRAYKNILMLSTWNCGNRESFELIKYSSENGILQSTKTSIPVDSLSCRMSSNIKAGVKKQKTSSEEMSLESVNINAPDISPISEKTNSDNQSPNKSSSMDQIAINKTLSSCFQPNLQEMKLESSSHCPKKSRARRQKMHLNEIRQWEYSTSGSDSDSDHLGKANSHHFTLMSYNVLSQTLLEDHPHLYYNHDPAALSWEWRSESLIKEIEEFSPDFLCLQEVQESHLESFYDPKLQNLGYSGIYKKRTGNKPDGVAIYYKVSAFHLEEHSSVEFMQPFMPVLNRDNVALIARFSSLLTPSLPHMCIATTHLLYNPRRIDVKLAQIQLLLAELERLAYVGNCSTTSYHPVIITGDLNVKPNSSLYRLLTSGVLWDSDITDGMFDALGITHNCQHFSIVSKRKNTGVYNCDRYSELKDLKVFNSDNAKAILKMTSRDDFHPEATHGLSVDRKKGYLSHNFTLKSVYKHRNSRGKEATTRQDKWVTVDYIFYSCMARDLNLEPVEGNIKLVARYGLLCKEECFTYGPIPNLCSPSDHFPLICKFNLTS